MLLPHSATNGPRRRSGVRMWVGLPFAADGAQIGSQGLTRRSVLLSEIWRGSAPFCGVAVGGTILQLSE